MRFLKIEWEQKFFSREIIKKTGGGVTTGNCSKLHLFFFHISILFNINYTSARKTITVNDFLSAP